MDENGLVSAMGGGTATVTALSSNGVKATCDIEVQVAVTSVSLEPAELEMLPDETAALTATLLPASSTGKTIVWTSSDETVVTVDSEGQLTATGTGRATVRATSHNGLYAETAVHVYVPAETLTLNENEAVMFQDETLQLTLTVTPENATYQTAIWTVSDETVASVDETGLVTALSTGTTEITATTEEGKSAACSIQVYAIPENIFRIPNGTVEIEEEAFRNTAADYIVIPESTEVIGNAAFADSSVIIAEFSNGDVQIADDAFDTESLLRVIAPAGGTVEAWATGNEIPFRAK